MHHNFIDNKYIIIHIYLSCCLIIQEPKLWYGIGILYDRYGSYEHAEEAFSAVIKMDPKFEKANEIYFRLGIIYKQQTKYDLSLQVNFSDNFLSYNINLLREY